MRGYAEWMSKLVDSLVKLPGIGRKSAERIVFHLLVTKREDVARLSQLLLDLKEHVFFCKTCHNFSDKETCHICSDPARDQKLICVVEDPKDVIAVEKTGQYVGVYHVLLGALSPLEGIGPDEIQIGDLVQRVKDVKPREIILATNPNTEGETTALYLAKILKGTPVKITRIARGIPVGSHLEYADQATLAKALDGRLPV